MNVKFLITLVTGLLISISRSSAELSPEDAERLCKKLKFGGVSCFIEIRDQFKTRTNAVEYLKNYLEEKDLQAQVSSQLQNVMDEVEKTLRANPSDIALISVTIDSSIKSSRTEYKVRALRFEGTGDDAVQILAPHVFARSQLTLLTKAPAEGFIYDTNRSHVICVGFDEGEIKAAPIYLPTMRSALIAAIEDLKKAEAAPQRPLPPSNLRIKLTP